MASLNSPAFTLHAQFIAPTGSLQGVARNFLNFDLIKFPILIPLLAPPKTQLFLFRQGSG
jgi:hypothetical protein